MNDKTSTEDKAVDGAESARPKIEMPKGQGTEVSAPAIARMMGVATSSELKILEGQLDLIAGRVNGMITKVDRIVASFQKMPTGADLERIDVQLGALKTMLRDLTAVVGGGKIENGPTAADLTNSSSTQILSSADDEVEAS